MIGKKGIKAGLEHINEGMICSLMFKHSTNIPKLEINDVISFLLFNATVYLKV